MEFMSEILRYFSQRSIAFPSYVSIMCWSLVQRSPTVCVASECDLETSLMRRPWTTRAVELVEKKIYPIKHRIKKVIIK